MDAKITKKRLGLLLSYDWIKIVGICVAAVLVWCLLFTTFGTRPSNGQTFEMYLYPGVSLSSSVDEDTFHAKDENGALSYDVLDFSYVSLAEDTMDTIIAAHFAAGQGDVLFAADLEPTEDEDGNVTGYNGLDDFLSRYYSHAAWLGTDLQDEPVVGSGGETLGTFSNYFADCAEYLDGFYDGGWEKGTLNEEKVRGYFDDRMQGDKRFKNEAQREAGRKKEIGRIENLRAAFAKVWGWVSSEDENSPLRIKTTTVTVDLDGDGTEETVEWQFAFDLSNIDDLTKILSYPDDNGTGTKDGLCMVILNQGSSDEQALRYEPITLLEYLVKTYAPDRY